MDSDPFVAALLRMTRGGRCAPQDDARWSLRASGWRVVAARLRM